jgi:predicted nucleic acid-binding protein
VYSFDYRNKRKREIAKNIITNALMDGRGFISIQVIQEFFNVATNKFELPMSVIDAKSYLEKVFVVFNIVFPNTDTISTGLDIFSSTKYSFYDSLIIAAAVKSGSKILLTEDLNHGQMIQNVKIKNPFMKL